MSSAPFSSPLEALGRADLTVRVMRTAELALFLSGCNTWKSGLCTLLGQHSGASPDGEGTGEAALRVWEGERWPSHSWEIGTHAFTG